MDLGFSAEEIAFRDEVRDVRRQEPARLDPRQARRRAATPARTTSSPGRASSPPRAGRCRIGRSNGAARAGARSSCSIFNDEIQRGHAPESLAFGTSMVGPVIYTFGSQAQKERFLPRIADLATGGARAFPSRARDRTSRACAPAPSATAIAGSSTARRPGRRSRNTPTGFSCSRAPTRA